MSKALPLISLSLLLCSGAGAQTPENAPQPKFEFGFEQRIRNENWNNITDYSDKTDDEREQIRYRTRLWMKAPLGSNIDFFVGLNQETNQKMGKVNQLDEVIFESLYVDFKRVFVKGLSLRVGRQNLMRGEGFLLFEGNSGDGSRTTYFNAIDLAYTHKKSTLELIGIDNPSQDRMLPILHDWHKRLTEWDEQALGAYYTDKNLKNTSVEAYYFYKKEVHDYRPVTNAQFQPDRHISTVGGRVVQKLNPVWSATGEFAAQWGAQHPDTKISGWAGYGYLKRTWKHAWKPYVLGGYWAFSGDDPSTKNRVEGWDPIFSRWPKWSELYIYSQVKEKGVAYWTNLGMFQGEGGFSPSKKVDFRFTFYQMNAFHTFPGSQAMFGSGTNRGQNVQARMDFVPYKNFKGHVLYEQQLPGSFYHAQPTAYFLRFEISYLIRYTPTVEQLKRQFGGGR